MRYGEQDCAFSRDRKMDGKRRLTEEEADIPAAKRKWMDSLDGNANDVWSDM